MNRRFQSWPTFRIAAPLLLAGLLGGAVATPLRAEDHSKSASGLSGHIASQAALLGDPSFGVRERATRNLIELGIASRPALLPLRDAQDAEVRSRARQILTIVGEADFRVRLDAFAEDWQGKSQADLPSWDLFRREIGDSREARAMFVAMQRSEGNLLALLADDPKAAAAQFAERCQVVQMNIHAQSEPGFFATAGTVGALLFVGAAEDVQVDEQEAIYMENIVHYAPFEEALRNGLMGGTARRLLGRWVAKNATPVTSMQNLTLAFNYDLREGADLAKQMLGREIDPVEIRPYALLALGRFGTVDDLAVVERFFKDARVCVRHRGGSRELHIEVRDVALAVALHLTHQEVKPYGFAHVQSNPQMLYMPSSLWFGDDATRVAAFKKWSEWQASQPPSAK